MKDDDERWEPIEGYEGIYEVSDGGRIKSLFRRDGRGCLVTEKIRKATPDPKGYLRLFLCRDGKNRTFLVHRLVAAAFIGRCPPGFVVNHKNGIKADNGRENLEYTTCAENSLHAYRQGFLPAPPVTTGESHPLAKLTDDLVREIRRTKGIKSCNIWAAELGMSKSAVKDARSGRRWSHVI